MIDPTRAVDDLIDRFEALDRFIKLVEAPVRAHPPAWVTPELLPSARHLAARAGERLGHSRDHTVVALAGATGSGKSSLFNAIARIELSPAGVLRPTTGSVHACVWNPSGADSLLDWLAVERGRRFARESVLDAQDEARLRGLVLLDLPDMDSVATHHRLEADRLVDVVDLVIWVLDPQKYADSAVHEGYLRHMSALREVTIVAFNQVDRLSPADAARCRADLVRLVEVDGLMGVPVIATSARTGVGVGELRELLEKAVASRQMAIARVEGELDEAVATLAPLVGPDRAEDAVSRDAIDGIATEFAAAGVTTLAAEAAEEFHRRRSLPGWPFRRARRFDAAGISWAADADVRPADPALVGATMRRLAASAAGGLPAPWPDAIRAAASASIDAVPDHLAQAMCLALPRQPSVVGWYVARTVWWLAALSTVVGAAWWGWDRAVGPVAGMSPPPMVSGVRLPELLVLAGLATAVLIVLVGRPFALVRARRFRIRAQRQLGDAAVAVARDNVAPVRGLLRTYADARTAWRAARGARPAVSAPELVRSAVPAAAPDSESTTRRRTHSPPGRP